MTRYRDTAGHELSEVLALERTRLLHYLQRRLDHDQAADALAEVMMVAWRRVEKLPDDAEQARMWLYGIARNVVATSRRSEQRQLGLAGRLLNVLATADRTAPPADDGADVRDAIDRLTPDQAELVRLIHWDGFTIAEAGQIIGVTASTARTRYQRARADLRDALDPTEPPPAHSNTALRSPRARSA